MSINLQSEPTPPAVTVYDPAMCCSTGVCGPSVDPALAAFSRDVRWLEERGVTVTRYGLASEPHAFAENPRVQGLLAAFGTDALPAVMVCEEIVAYGRYPQRDELATFIQAATTPRRGGGCGGSGADASGCC